jgi:hypothetical protein
MLLVGKLLQVGEKWCNRLQETTVPILIIDGTDDYVLPHGVGLTAPLARGI